MTIQVTLIIMKLVIAIETSKLWWLRFIKQRITWISQLWTLCLKGEITRIILDIFEFTTKRKRTVKMSLETLNYRFPQLWSILPENLTQINSPGQFKQSVMGLYDRPCRLCKLCQTSGFWSIYLLVMYIDKHPILA